MKKGLCIALCLLLSLALLCSCGPDEGSSSQPESSLPESSLPESSLPESSLPESSAPESSAPASSAPESSSEPEIHYMTPVEFVSKYAGTWTSDSGKFMWFNMDGKTPSAMFAIWYAGGPFPAGKISKVYTLGEDKFEITLDCPAIPASEMNDAIAAHQEKFTIEDLHNNSLRIQPAGGSAEIYSFNASMQYPLEDPHAVSADEQTKLLAFLDGNWDHTTEPYFVHFGKVDSDVAVVFGIHNAGAGRGYGAMESLIRPEKDTYLMLLHFAAMESEEFSAAEEYVEITVKVDYNNPHSIQVENAKWDMSGTYAR